VLVALLVTSPSICHNIVWTWTKMLTAVYVIAALHFYLRGWRRGSSLHLTLAFVLLTAGVLVHYSALVFAVFIFPHFLLMTILRRRVDLRQWLITGVICTLLLASWFAFSVIVFGAHQTFRGNSTAAGFSDSKAPSAAKVITAHCYYSLLPFAVRDPSLKVPQTNPPYGRVRDYWFRQYQTNLWGMIGSGGGLVALWLVIRSLRQDRRPNALDRWFWLAFLPVTYIVGCAVVPPPIQTEGVAHACLLPLALLALTLIAAQFHRLPKWAKWTLAITRVWDFAIGVWFQLWMEGLTFALYTERLLPDNTPYRFDPSHRAEGRAVDNWATVQLAHTYFWGDNFRFALEPLRGLCAVAGAAAIIVVADLQGKLLPIWQRIRPAPKPVTAPVGPSTRRERRRR
jgi:4-amino-4-deoxy-L-arabinose transferase-like glycosyltransferase